MQQRTRLAILLGGTFFSSIAVIAACSTESETQPLPGQGDSGRTKTDGSGNNSSGGEDDGGSGTDAAADCSAAPKPGTHAGVYCFGGTNSNDAGYCNVGDTKISCADAKDSTGKFIKAKCADAVDDGNGGYDEGACNFQGDGGREWHCTEKAHCPDQSECCVTAGTGGTPSAQADTQEFPGCGTFFNSSDIKFVGGTRCKTSCGSNELTLCAKDEDCKGGKTCKFFKLSSRFSGVCK